MNTTQTPVIQATDLTKRFGSFVAVDGVSFAVMPGECFGFLGPNGAGKSSTIRMIGGVSPITGGRLTVAGLDVARNPQAVRSILGVVPQEDNLDTDLTAIQNLRVYARYFGIPLHVTKERALRFLEQFGLSEKANAEIDALSGGMKRRLIIARALMTDPGILVLDEPTTGLDPQAKHMVWQNLRMLKAQGKSMLLTTHNMEEAAALCDRLVVMDMGRILVEGTPRELVRRYAGFHVLELHPRFEDRDPVLARLAELEVLFQDGGDRFYLYHTEPGRLDGMMESLEEERVLRREANLEDVFFILTGRGLRVE